MAIATYMGDARLADKDFESIFYTEVVANLNEALQLVREVDLNQTDRYRVGESVFGIVVAPKSNENGETKYFAPHPGKNVFVTTDIYKFGMKSTQEYREWGKGPYERFPIHMAEVLNYTVKVKIFNMYNQAFDANAPNKYTNLALCATNHPLSTSGVGSNKLATSADLNEQAVEAAAELMLRTPTEMGVSDMRYRPTRLISALAKWGDNFRLANSMSTVHTENNRGPNVPNANRDVFGFSSYFHPMLVNRDSWFLQSQESPIAVVWSRRPTLYGGEQFRGIDQAVPWEAKMQLAVVADSWRGIVGVEG
jgi:hypothetical protein